MRVRLTVAYDGAGYHGFAVNPGVRTVGGTLATALRKVLGYPVTLTCAGRTDTGVHAWGQVVSFDASADRLDLDGLRRALNQLCGPSIAVRAAEVAPAEFDARRSATGRTYRYTVLNSPVPNPFLASWTWRVEQPLDVDALQLGCDPLIGEHDFSSFCRRPKVPAGLEEASLVRRVVDARWVELGEDVLRFEISGSAFCQQMVRSLVGTLVDMGTGRRRAGEMSGILRARSRQAAGGLAPPNGLCLWSVDYEPTCTPAQPSGTLGSSPESMA